MFYLGIVAAAFFGDQHLKSRTEEFMQLEDEQPILNGNIILRKFHNEGMALQTFAKYPWAVRFMNAGVVLLIALHWIHLMHQPGRKGLKMGLSLILGGGLSNLYDRFTRGYVVDYFSIKLPKSLEGIKAFDKIKGIEKLIFNLADIFIMLGGLVVLFHSGGKNSKKKDSLVEEDI